MGREGKKLKRDTDGGVVDVVIGSDHSKIQRRQIHLILNSNTLEENQKNTHITTYISGGAFLYYVHVRTYLHNVHYVL